MFFVGIWLALSLVTVGALAFAYRSGDASTAEQVSVDVPPTATLAPGGETPTPTREITAPPPTATDEVGSLPPTETPVAATATTEQPPTPSVPPPPTPVAPEDLQIAVSWPSKLGVNRAQTVRLTVDPIFADGTAVVGVGIELTVVPTGTAQSTSVAVPAPESIMPQLDQSAYSLVALGASLQSSSLAIAPDETEVKKAFRVDGLEWEWTISTGQTGTHTLSLVLKGYWETNADAVDYDLWNTNQQVKVARRFSVFQLPILTIVTALFGNGLLTGAIAWGYTQRKARREETAQSQPPPPPATHTS